MENPCDPPGPGKPKACQHGLGFNCETCWPKPATITPGRRPHPSALTGDAHRQLARLRGAPSLVLWLVQEVGCWVVGSRADFTLDRVHEGSDWDILVQPSLWGVAVGGIPLDHVKATRRGGWRVVMEGKPVIDVFPGDLSDWMSKACTRVAWHPKSGVVIEKV